MRNFFNSHWKVILAILLAIVLATLTVETRSGTLSMSARLQAHAHALAPDSRRSAARHVESSLMRQGYAPRQQRSGDGARAIEATVSNLVPGMRPSQTFIVGARLGQDGDAGTIAVLELARALKDLRPAPGTEIRFVFVLENGAQAEAGAPALPGRHGDGNFMAYVGPHAAARRVGQALASLRGDQQLMRQGLAAPAHVMGVTVSHHAGALEDGPTLVITDAGFLRYPYFRAWADKADRTDYDAMARVVEGLARTLKALAGPVEA